MPGCLDAVRCTVRARKWPFIATSSDLVLSTSSLIACERNKRCHILQSQKGKCLTCLEYDSVSYRDHWYTWISCRVRHGLSFILIEWWSSESATEQHQYSGGLCPLDLVCPCWFMMRRQRGRVTILDVMHEMWCGAKIPILSRFFFFFFPRKKICFLCDS